MAQKNGNPHPTNHPMAITMIVAGTEVKLQVKPDEVLSEALEKALKKSHNTGQPIEKWELKTEDGRALNMAGTFAALGLGEGSLLFATLSAGAAG